MSFEVFLRECADLGLTITLEPVVVDNVAGYRALVVAGETAPCMRLAHEAVVIGSEVVTCKTVRNAARGLSTASPSAKSAARST